jgi:hypothetical protein
MTPCQKWLAALLISACPQPPTGLHADKQVFKGCKKNWKAGWVWSALLMRYAYQARASTMQKKKELPDLPWPSMGAGGLTDSFCLSVLHHGPRVDLGCIPMKF